MRRLLIAINVIRPINDCTLGKKKEKAKLRQVEVRLPGLRGIWVADDNQQKAAWELYVELVTRIAVEPLGMRDGLLREALSSLHALFGETRRILKEYGPAVAEAHEKGDLSFGAIAIDVLNHGLRPVLSKWHPALSDHEALCPPGKSRSAHEREWSEFDTFREELESLRKVMTGFADLLASAAGISSLHIKPEPEGD